MKMFSAYDAVQFAIRIEENGEAWYREAGSTAVDEEAKQLFLRLAEKEADHRGLFQRMLDNLGNRPLLESYPGEYLAYLRDHIDGRAVFERDGRSGPEAGSDASKVLEFALQRELDSMLYFEALKAFVVDRDLKAVDAIIAEERMHFTELSRIRDRSR
ncbi:MAG TPA: ferritin family protein [Anaeromyxobacteraceae bacterium]|nr:ferritin family protein [Anaeromyxobacteraceae bacterium]